ncbi:MAG: histidinol-phosphate transaminase [Bacteroidetes bacterium]|nr:histidinol-phosphate transaminase [Bacteroidota bacterium]MBS1539714.1 histidinol-phosphate transaminase [Bacteroidota bacterium]
MIDLSNLIRPNIQSITPYSSARDEFEGDARIFLDANENPFAGEYNRYPDPHQKELKRKLAIIKNISENQLFIGNGSDEAIDLLFRAFCIPSVDEVIIPQPTYGMYSVSAHIQDVKIKSPTLTRDFDLDIDQILSQVTSRTKLIFLCNPNNPTGNKLNSDRITQLLQQFSGLVIIDEAYIDFSPSFSWVTQLSQFSNLVVLQTLSKAWGLASLRLGLCMATPEIISILNKIKPPYNISGIAQQAALRALEQVDEKEKAVKEILLQRTLLEKELTLLPQTIQVYPSEANFILVKMTDASGIYKKLIAKGIVVRNRSNVILCSHCLRITVGTAEENEQLINELKQA